MQELLKPIQIDDVRADDVYREGNDLRVATADLAGARTFMLIPIDNEGRLLGALTIYRQDVRAFTREQIALVQAFAFQAALALANARLVKDLEARRRELAELNAALEERVQQQVLQIERYARLRRFVPPQLADLMLGEHPDRYLESHRREVAVLSCDLRGFTALSEGMEPELVMGVLKDYHACIGVLSEKFEATLERFAGDGVMLLFNDPLPCPNPAERAVRMGVALRQRIGAIAETWRKLEFDIGFRIGVAYGYATLGQIGFEGRYDYAAIGPIPSLASGLCENTGDGQILVSQRVLAAVQDLVETAPMHDLRIRGFARPVRAHNVLCLRSAVSPDAREAGA
jgi:adenylate cyclase